jgi:hypothetical protein
MSTTNRYCTSSIRLMLAPYIASRRSNSVVSKVLGGTSFVLCVVWFNERFAAAFGKVSSASLSSGESESDSGGSLGISTGATGSFFVTAFFEIDAEDFAVGLGASFAFFFFLSSSERIVGGSCIGSPAKMSFFALNMGIQHT